MDYKSTGVDLDRAAFFLRRIRPLMQSTHSAAVVPYIEGFAGLYRMPGRPGVLLAASCDGVGTKLLIARALGRYRELGRDLVAMNVNDLVVCGATPLFFLDYLATGKIDPEAHCELVAGMADACRESGCVLLGGETAEMPDAYSGSEFDLAGFAVGTVEERHLPRRDSIAAGDLVLACLSSGIHANGLTLARHALARGGVSWSDPLDADKDAEKDTHATPLTVGDALLVPAAIYVRPVMDVMRTMPGAIKSAAHVTGGGLLGRAAQLAPPPYRVRLDPASFPRPRIFDRIASAGQISEHEMACTFNLGLGFLIVAAPDAAAQILRLPESPWRAVGHIQAGPAGAALGEVSLDRTH